MTIGELFTSARKNGRKAYRKTKTEAGKAKSKIAASETGKKTMKAYTDWKPLLKATFLWIVIVHVVYVIYSWRIEPKIGITVPYSFWLFIGIAALLAISKDKRANQNLGVRKSRNAAALAIGGYLLYITWQYCAVTFYLWFRPEPISPAWKLFVAVPFIAFTLLQSKFGSNDQLNGARYAERLNEVVGYIWWCIQWPLYVILALFTVRASPWAAEFRDLVTNIAGLL